MAKQKNKISRNSANSVAGELWANGRDSLLHALNHFSDRNNQRANAEHHDKWIALSVHHAAECICNMRLFELDPTHPSLARAPSWLPSLNATLQVLSGPHLNSRLTPAEKKLVDLLAALVPIRNQFMHRMVPTGWDVSEAAMCMIGLLKYAERLRGETAHDIVWQSMPIETEVMAAVQYRHVEAYCQFAGLFVAEKYPNEELLRCPACEVEAVANDKCEACYEELGKVECPLTLKPAYYIAIEEYVGHVTHVDCPHCDSAHAI